MPAGSHPHDVAPARDGGVWYTAQASGRLGWLDPRTGRTRETPLGEGSAPHGVIVGPDGAPWITDGGLNAIVRVDPRTLAVKAYPLPASAPDANLNTAVFDLAGRLWFTGQAGFYGRLDPAHRTHPGLACARRLRALRDHRHARGRRVLRLARRQPRRSHRRPRRPGDTAPAADARPGSAPGLVRLAGSHLGERVERRAARDVRPCEEALARMEAPRRRSAGVRRLRRRARPRLGHRLRWQRLAPLRPGHRSASRPSGTARPARACVSSSAARARSGARSQASTGSSWPAVAGDGSPPAETTPRSPCSRARIGATGDL